MELYMHRFLPVTEVEGPGKRACLWVQGCSIQCDGCGVPWTWKKSNGIKISVDELFQNIMDSKQQNDIEGVTFLGGEPFDQAGELAELGAKIKRAGLSLMTFSGHEYEDLLASEKKEWSDLLAVTDLLIDGPFVKEKLDLSRPWMGSSNQNYRFLTPRYQHLKEELVNIPNKLEVRVSKEGKVSVNGMATQETLEEVFQRSEFKRVIRE